MRLTLTLDPRRGTLLIIADGVADYPPGHFAQALVAAVQRAVHQLDNSLSAEQLPAAGDQRVGGSKLLKPKPTELAVAPADPGHGPDAVAHHDNCDLDGRDEAVTRRRMLRMLDDGTTERQAADRFGVDPAQVARWDDDAARDAHTDLLTDGHGWPGRVAS